MTHGVSPTRLIHRGVTSRYDRALASVLARSSHSWKMALDRAEVVCTPTIGPGSQVNLFLQRGEGGTVVDLDGVAFIDFSMGAGTILLGHNHPEIRTALQNQVAAGWQFGLPTELQLDVARNIRAAGAANERVALCSNGSDATLFSMRAARAVTGKDVIGVFAGSCHGTHDYGLLSLEPRTEAHPTRAVHAGAGIPHIVDDTATILPYGHPAAFDLIRRHRSELAAVIVEPVRGTAPHLDAGPWLRDLVSVCHKCGVLVIFDELTTGFRLAYGGAQELFGVAPDFVAYGKALGGGLPLGAVAGPGELMQAFQRDPSLRGSCSPGIFAGSPLAVAASGAFLNHISAMRPALYLDLEAATARLATAFHAAAGALDVPAALHHAGSMFRIILGPTHPRNGTVAAQRAAADAFAVATLNGGVLLHSRLRGYLSTAHTQSQIDTATAVFASALADLKADGLFEPLRH